MTLREDREVRDHPREMRSAVVNEFHPSTIVPTYGAGRAGKSEVVGQRKHSGQQSEVGSRGTEVSIKSLGIALICIYDGFNRGLYFI